MLKTSGDAAAIVTALNARDIAAHRMYLPPLYKHAYFAGLDVVNQEGKTLPGSASPEQKMALMINSEMMQRSVFGVPFHAFMDEEGTAQVAHILASVLEQPRGKAAAAR
jgi:dTDP-4-amino-4,6-dideoxygalactose transaminase